MFLAIALSTTLTLGATPALAQDDDVYINPDSPSGVEYDLPLERARRDADPERPSGAPVAQNEQSSVPFGVGVGGPERAADSPTTAAAGEQAPSPRRQRGSRSKATRSGERRRPLPPEIVAASARPVSPANGIGTTLLYGAGGGLVIAAGALAGLALRRRRG